MVGERGSGSFEPFPLAAIEQSIAKRFEDVARRHPERPALETDAHRLSYGELNRAANQIAQAVLERRGERSEPIAVLMDRSAPSIAAAIALAKAGKIYVPLDPSFPERRLAAMLADCRPGLLLVSSHRAGLARAVSEGSCDVLNVEAFDAAGGVEDPGVAVLPDALAYILYTSGSTGRPKGVAHSHLGLLHQILRHTNALRIGPEDRVTMLGSASAAQSNTQLYLALLNGAALFPRDLKREGLADLAAWLTRNRITYYRSSASVFRHWARHLDGSACPTLRLVAIGGEPVYRRDVELHRAHFRPECLLVNALSSTETGTLCMHVLERDTAIEGHVVPVGRPLAGCDVCLVDDAGATVGGGEVGEIAVRSCGLAAGYYAEGVLHRSAFVADPADGRLRTYRTGDLGRWLAGGALLQLGRKDSLVKISGHRVDIGEVETALRASDGVDHVAVVEREDTRGERRLVAYVVPNGSKPPSRGGLRRFLKERLPEHMIPSSFELIDELPLTGSGKVDRQALPRVVAPLAPEAASAGRLGLLGTQLGALWEELLGVSGVGPRDDFLDLGGDSLLAIEMLLRIEKVCGRTLAPSRLLGAGITLDRLVDLLMEDEQASFGRPMNAVQVEGSRRVLFFLHGDHENGGLYCHALARCLGPDQPFYAVTPHGLDGDALPWSIEAMASERLSAVRAVQPTGPYRLGGFCTGGIIAFEMARQLEAAGEAVETLLVIDAALENASLPFRLLGRASRRLAAGLSWSEPARREAHLRLRLALEAYGESARSGGWGRARFVAGKLRSLPERLRATAQAAAGGAETDAGGSAHFARHLAQHAAYGARRRDYVPGRFTGAVALFRSEYLRDKAPGDATAGWCHVAAAVDVHWLPGSHQSTVTRHAAFLAERMKAYLR